MNKMIRLLILTCAVFFSLVTQATAINSCATRERCPVNQTCVCSPGADSYNDRFFYFIFPQLEKNSHYQCTFASSLSNVLLDSITNTDGITSTLVHGAGLPLTLTIDTTAMTKNEGETTIRYRVTPCDIAATITTRCEKQ